MTDLQRVQQFKTSDGVHRHEVDGTSYGLLILDRGESMFFQRGDRALICEISARESVVYSSSIRSWDDGTRISGSERSDVLTEICALYLRCYHDSLGVH